MHTTRLFPLLLVNLLAVGAAQAAVTFTFTGTITQDGGDAFALGETFTLSFTTSDSLGAPNFSNDASGVYWTQTDDPSTQIWSNLSLSGATGAYQTPDPVDADGDLRSDDDRPLFMSAYTDSVTTGLGLVRGGEEFYYFEAWMVPSGSFASYGGTAAVRADNTFINGTYAVTTSVGGYFTTDGFANEYYASFSSVTISGGVASVPEPASAAALFGLAALGAIATRRRRE